MALETVLGLFVGLLFIVPLLQGMKSDKEREKDRDSRGQWYGKQESQRHAIPLSGKNTASTHFPAEKSTSAVVGGGRSRIVTSAVRFTLTTFPVGGVFSFFFLAFSDVASSASEVVLESDSRKEVRDQGRTELRDVSIRHHHTGTPQVMYHSSHTTHTSQATPQATPPCHTSLATPHWPHLPGSTCSGWVFF